MTPRRALAAAAVAAAGCGEPRAAPRDAAPAEAAVDAAEVTICSAPQPGGNVTARKIGRVDGRAVLATSPPGDPRLFVIEQQGVIRIFDAQRRLVAQPFLDLSASNGGPVSTPSEAGLLGLAFHPRYATTGELFVFYTTRRGGVPLRDVLARCRVGLDPDRADPATCVEVLAIPDFAENHNGGMIEFGRDGYLYIGTGDGGLANDPNRNGQAVVDDGATVALLGKILRIDVDARPPGKQYGIPADNPFAGGGGAPEIFIRGVRNPWRWSFDRETGDLWIADVGQDRYEELNVLRPAEQRGANLGWSMYEAEACFHAPCDPTGMTFPKDVRLHPTYRAIIGGQVYRGACYPDLVGWYLYTDHSQHGMARARLRADGTLEVVDLPGTFPQVPASLHEDAAGELYLTDTAGNVYHLEASP